MMAGGRLLREHREVQEVASAAGADAEILLASEDGIRSHWVGHVRGPADTPHEVRFPLFFFFSPTIYLSVEECGRKGEGTSSRRPCGMVWEEVQGLASS